MIRRAVPVAQNPVAIKQSKPLRTLFDAMHHGKYEYEDFLNGNIASSITTTRFRQRTLYRPDKKLKAYLVFLNTFLFERLAVNGRVVYSYRKGINPHEVAFAHAHSRAFFQTDIENFFGSIDRALVQSTVLSQKDRIPISDLTAHVERILDLTTIGGVLPIGFPTSPVISNVCLTPFDNDLENYCAMSDLIYTRYADDIVVSGRNRKALEGLDSKLSETLRHHFGDSLRLNRSKRKLTAVGRKTRILGMVILPNGRVTIDMKLKKRVEVLLHFFVRNRQKFLDMSAGDLNAGIQKLGGYINYINAADKPYLVKLKRKFGATVIDSFIHRSAK